MDWQPLPIVGGSYADDTRPWSVQDTVNYIPVAAEAPGARSQSLLRCAPGFSLFANTGANAPARGLHNAEGTLFYVAGNSLYQVNPDASSSVIGTIPGVGRVSMAHNQVAGGNQIGIAANSAGYYYDTSTGVFDQITDEGFPGASFFDYINQFIVGIDPSRNFAFTSDLADITSYNTLDRIQAESQPDKLVGQIVTHGEWWLFGERTIQPFQDTGAGTGTFQAAQGEILEVGCASGFTVRKMDNSVFWLGNDGIVYRANGYTPQRVSTGPIEQAISRSNLTQAFAFTYEDKGHKIYYLTLPDGHTWGYDAGSGQWHRRQSYGLSRWRISDMVYWNSRWIGADYANGKLYEMDWENITEDGAILERRRILPVTSDNQNALIINGLEIVAQTGVQSAFAPLRIGGDLPDGFVGQSGTFHYGISGGIAPRTVSLLSGALPDGATLNSTGQISYDYTTAGTFTWSVRVTDANGTTADLNDSAVISATVMDAQLSDWKYLQITDSDNTDYSASDFDDSGWSTGTAPFGAWWNGNTTLPAASAYDPRFSSTFATTWDVNTRLWMRRTLTLSELPPEGLRIIAFMDDHFKFYINGTLIVTSTPNPQGGSGQTFDVDVTNLTTGDNSIAIACFDEEPAQSGSVTYADYLIEVQ